MPLTVIVFLTVDVVTSSIAQAVGVEDLGRAGLVASGQRLILVAAAAAIMWNRPRLAIPLVAVVVALVFAVGPTGEELWLEMIAAVTVAVRANRWQLGLFLLAVSGYAVAFGRLVERRWPGEGWSATLVMLAFVGGALTLGFAARLLLQARDRRRLRVRQLEQEQAEIRVIERARLADELQTVVNHGLATIDDDLAQVQRGSRDLDSLRSGLGRIDHHARSLLTELRTLLDVLRREPAPNPDGRPAAPGPGPGRRADRGTSWQVRIAATAVSALLAVRAAWGDLGSVPDAEQVVQVVGFLACGVAVWRPAAGVAAAALAGSIVIEAAGYWDALSTTLICLVAALCCGVRRFWLVIFAVAGYAALLVPTASTDPTDHVLLVCLAGFVAVGLGLSARHLVAAREDAQRRLADLGDEGIQLTSQERGAVARELHDVVAHSLSVTTMLVMATSMSSDVRRLADTVDRIRRSTEAAHGELSTLLGGMRTPDLDPGASGSLISPVVGASVLARQLQEHGYHPRLDIDPAANSLDPTTQRTLSRILQEGTTNILRYAPPGSPCQFTLEVDATMTRLRIDSPVATTERRSDLSLGWGLRGIRERVELTEGTFSAGPDRGRWVLDVTLPTVQAAEAILVH